MKKILISILISIMIAGAFSIISCGKKEKKETPTKIEKKKVQKKPQKEKRSTPKISKKEKSQPTIVKEKKSTHKKQQKIVLEEKKYELQLVARKDYSRVEIEKKQLEKHGYNLKITNTLKNGQTYYRLRLTGLYTPSQAKKLGNEIKKLFPSINDYWVVKVQ